MNLKIQVVIIEKNGRRKGLYRHQRTGGGYPRKWHRMPVQQALKALRDGITEIQAGRILEVEEYIIKA